MRARPSPGRRAGGFLGGCIATLCIATLCITPRVGAQDAGASRGGLILALPTSTRALGLAGAVMAAAADEWSVFSAPASLGSIHAPMGGASTEGYLASTQLSAAALAIPAWGGALAVGVTLLDYGSIAELAASTPGTDGTATGRTFTAQDNAIVLGYGHAVPGTRGLRLGGAAELVNSHVADLSGSAVAFTGSASWTPEPGWDVAAAAQHVGADLLLGATRGALPRTLRIALAAPSRRVGILDVRPMLEARDERGAGQAVAAAAEATWSGAGGRGLAFRAGYTWRTTADDRWPVSLGFGATLGAFGVDYAVERFATIGQVTHRVGLRYARRGAPSP